MTPAKDKPPAAHVSQIFSEINLYTSAGNICKYVSVFVKKKIAVTTHPTINAPRSDNKCVLQRYFHIESSLLLFNNSSRNANSRCISRHIF